jgi:hypothetical protein
MAQKTRKALEKAANTVTSIRSKQQAINHLTAGDYLLPGKQIDMHIVFAGPVWSGF